MSGEERPRRSRRSRRQTSGPGPVTAGISGGRFQPFSQPQMERIDAAIRHVLTEIGFADAPEIVREAFFARGGRLTADDRLVCPPGLLDQFLAETGRALTLYGQAPGHELHLTGKRVYLGTGGAAPQVVDLQTGRYRDARLQDLYDATRLVDALDHIHFFSRSLVARDMPDSLALDVNTAYACLTGTGKHICTSISEPANVAAVADICAIVAGSRETFRARPFLSLNINHVVPPLRLDPVSCETMAAAVRQGIPVHCNAFGQVGASSPVTLAGTVVQNLAEALIGAIFAWLIDQEAKIILGPRPMLTDLRTGGMAGGGGEQALVMAAAAQMAGYYNLPNSCIAGAADSKVADAQSGYEKGVTVTLAAQAGANMVTQAAGMQAGLMAVSFASYVVDNDMLGSITRTLAPIEVTEESLALEMIAATVRGPGHFLGHPETYKRMASDFLYPAVADRRSPQEWEEAGAAEIGSVARTRAMELLQHHYPSHLSTACDQQIRAKYPVYLPLAKRYLAEE